MIAASMCPWCTPTGLLLVKKLIVLDPNSPRPISEVLCRKPVAIKLGTTLLEANGLLVHVNSLRLPT